MVFTKNKVLLTFSYIVLIGFLTDVFSYTISAGLSIGIPTGISLNIKTVHKKEHIGYDSGLAFNTADSELYFTFDVIKYDYQKIVSKELTGKIPIFYGIGCVINSTKKDTELGMEIVGGLEYIFNDIPFNIFFKLSPIVYIIPSVKPGIASVIGIRYIFK